MRRLLITLACVFTLGLFALMLAWRRERNAKSVFPAANAPALLNPMRRLIQRPEQTMADFGIRAGDRVLELGPGPGYFTSHAARAASPSGCVVAADLQPAMLKQLRTRLSPEVTSAVRTAAADATRLPFRDSAFDTAFLVAVLGEVPDPARALAELRRVLRPGGVVSFCETFNDPDYVREGVLRDLCWSAGLRVIKRRRKFLGYVMRCERVD
jgi:ubiquinone/menaquinone biosynthesis C-methylase UbiE